MLNLRHIYKSYNNHEVLCDISFAVNPGDIVAIIGDNGSGKTTLLNIMLGITRCDSGKILCDRHQVIGHVPQTTTFGKTIADMFDAPVEPWQRDYALDQVGLNNQTPDTLVQSLSEGQKTRLALAKALASQPTILLLDEPTNNLDEAGLAWLKNFIQTFNGSIAIVSHDRAFINSVATKIIELHKGVATQYIGNYDACQQQKDLERRAQQEQYEAYNIEHQRIEKNMRAIQTRARNGLRTNKLRDNDKAQHKWHQNNTQRSFSGQLKAVRSRLDKLEGVNPPENIKNYNLALHTGETSTHKLIIKLNSVTKSYHRTILNDVNLEIRGKERMHVCGVNGSGKTTLLKIVCGLVRPDRGEVILGPGVTIGYLSQDMNNLDHTRTALQNLAQITTDTTNTFHQAHRLGMTEVDLKKPICALSRGQQAKLAIAMLLLGSHQLLVLDEPTNHLDITTRKQIESALQDYQGAILFASHDKYFVNSLSPDSHFVLTCQDN